MRLDSNLSRPRGPSGQSAPQAHRRHLSQEEQYDRWAAARHHARRHSHGEMTATAAAAAAAQRRTGQANNGTHTFSPPRASALCYANSLDFVQFFCSDAIDSDDEDDGAKANNDSDMLTITRSMAFGGSIDTDDDADNHHQLHEGRMISLASNTFESTKSEVSELQVRLDSDLRITTSDNASACTPSKLSASSRQSSSDVTPYASNKKAVVVNTPRTCDLTPPRSNSSSLQSTPISRQDLPRKRLELSGGGDDHVSVGPGHIQSKSSSNHVKTAGGHIVATTNTSRLDANNNNADEPQESGTELVLVHMSKSAAVL